MYYFFNVFVNAKSRRKGVASAKLTISFKISKLLLTIIKDCLIPGNISNKLGQQFKNAQVISIQSAILRRKIGLQLPAILIPHLENNFLTLKKETEQ